MTKNIYPEYLDESTTASMAEKALYNAFRNQLPDTYFVFHGVAWLGRRRGRKRPADGEADFIVCHPKLGILVIEVKGGLVGRNRDGQWYSIRRNSGVKVNIKDPLAQARANKYALISKIQQLPNWPGALPTVEYAVAFPDGVTDLSAISVAGPSEIILQHQDLANVTGWMKTCMNYWQGEGDFIPPSVAGVEALKDLLALSWQLRPPRLGEQIDVESNQISKYTEEQFELLVQLNSIPRAAIRGCAGSGKTVLAITKAKKLASEGFNVLLTCYNKQLAKQLRWITGNQLRLQVYDFHELCRLYAAKTQFDEHSSWDEKKSDFFKEIMPTALLEAAAIGENYLFDAIIIDEGQDFEPEWFSALDLLLMDPKQGVFYVFYDDNQLLYNRPLQLPVETISRALTTNCRNTKSIHQVVMQFYKSDLFLKSRGPEGRKIDLQIWPEEPDEQRSLLVSVLGTLIFAEKVLTSDIVILGPRGLEGEPFITIPEIKTFQLVTENSQSDREIQCTSIRKFKGLESPVVVLIMPNNVWRLEEMMYVGLSRAQHHLVVLAASEVIVKLTQVTY